MRRDIPPLAEVRRLTEKKRDAWWTVMLVDPLATPLVRQVAMRTRITPNQITWGAFLLGLVSAACFLLGDWRWLVAGAVVYHFSFLLDCMDGKVARLTGQGSVFGAWLDFVFDRIRVMACAVALAYGQFERTGEVRYVWLAAAVIFLDGLRYINSLEIFKTRHTMRKQIKSRIRQARRDQDATQVAFMEDLLRENPEADVEQDLARAQAETATAGPLVAGGGQPVVPVPLSPAAQAPVVGRSVVNGSVGDLPAVDHGAGQAEPGGPEGESEPAPGAVAAPVVDLQQEFRRRFPWYLKLRGLLVRHRIRPHLISGIEFQMGVFIVGPLCDQVLPVAAASGALLLVFELAIIYKLLLSTRDFARTLDSLESSRTEVTVAA